MKASLYAIRGRSGWEWFCTLDRRVDQFYWFERYGPENGVLWFEPSLSLGQADWMRNRLNRKSGEWQREWDRFWRAELDIEEEAGKGSGSGRDKATSRRLPSPTGADSPGSAAVVKQKIFEKVRGEFVDDWKKRVGADCPYVERLQLQAAKIGQAERWTDDPLQSRGTKGLRSARLLDAAELARFYRLMEGRFLLQEEAHALLRSEWGEDSSVNGVLSRLGALIQAGVLTGNLRLLSGLRSEEGKDWRALFGKRSEWVCERCGSSGSSIVHSYCPSCGEDCPYCEACLGMGRVRSCSLLIAGVSSGTAAVSGSQEPLRNAEAKEAARAASSLGVRERWGLSPAQGEASRAALGFLSGDYRDSVPRGTPRFLIWAVTGAGKTEMIFPLLEHELVHGRKVLLATPRRDVVLELFPRLAKAFPDRKVVVLYGGSEDRWQRGEITLATTHQLIRFGDCFDLVIVDEVDAFPYHNNPQLQYACHRACRKDSGRMILLSATPPRLLQKEVRAGKVPHVRVPVRYHRHPLPEPRRDAVPSPERMLHAGRLDARLKREIHQSRERGAQIFFFVPQIQMVEPFVQLIRRTFPGMQVGGTSSKDEERSEKVMNFRGHVLDLLVTTTILERGVTVPKTDVFILGADSPLFDEAALVQMAGRAGRSKDDPSGRVRFFSKEWTRSQASALKQIRRMNKLARKRGYLLPIGDTHTQSRNRGDAG